MVPQRYLMCFWSKCALMCRRDQLHAQYTLIRFDCHGCETGGGPRRPHPEPIQVGAEADQDPEVEANSPQVGRPHRRRFSTLMEVHSHFEGAKSETQGEKWHWRAVTLLKALPLFLKSSILGTLVFEAHSSGTAEVHASRSSHGRTQNSVIHHRARSGNIRGGDCLDVSL